MRKLSRYSLVSFLSFCFFTVVFHTMASAHAALVMPVSPVVHPTAAPLPSPTVTSSASSPQAIALAVAQSTDGTTPLPAVLPPTATPSPVNIIITATPVPETPTVIPTAAPTTTPTPVATTIIPQPTVTTTPSPSPLPVTASAGDVEAFFSKYSDEYHVDRELLKKIARCESSFNASAENGPYAGMFQFAGQTWTSVRTVLGMDANQDLRKNAEESIRTAAYMIGHGQANAWSACL